MENVLLINYTGSKGGGALYALEMTRSLLKQNVSCVAVIASHNQDIKEWEKLPLKKLVIIDTYKSSFSLLKQSLFWRKKKEFIKEELKQYKIKNIFVPMITFWSNRINEIYPEALLLLTLHDPTPHSGEFYYYIQNIFSQQKMIKKASAIIVLSPNFILDVEKRYNKYGNVIYLPMGDYDYYQKGYNNSSNFNHGNFAVNFIFFGRISKYKGLLELGKAYSGLVKKTNNISLTIAGDGDFSEYQKTYKNLPNVKIENRWINNEEVESFFKGENLIAVLPYRDATQSGVIQICKTFSIPVIATNTGGLKEQLRNYESASILVEPGNYIELQKEMSRVVFDEEFRNELYRNAKQYVSPSNWEKSAIVIKNIMYKKE